jgi:hypothetical protein
MIANPRRLGNTQTASNLVHTPLSPYPPSHTASHFAPAHTHHHSPFPAPRLVESAPCVPGIPAGTDSRRPRYTKATSHSASVLARARGPFAQSSWLSSVRVWRSDAGARRRRRRRLRRGGKRDEARSKSCIGLGTEGDLCWSDGQEARKSAVSDVWDKSPVHKARQGKHKGTEK